MMKRSAQVGSLLVGLTAILAACTPTPTPPTYTCPADSTVTNIAAVQGTTETSPLAGKVVTVRGVVTLDAQTGLGGFYVQDVAPDGKADTSDGLFVFTTPTTRTVKEGQVVEVTGTVKEFNGLTELDTVTTLTSCGTTTLPTPAALTFPLATDTALEATEGMLVRVAQTMTVTDTFTLGRFGELGLSSGGRLFIPTNGQGGSAADNKRRTLRLDDLSTKQNPETIPYLTGNQAETATRRAGDTVSGLEGVMHYANSAYKLQPTKTPAFMASNPRTAAPKDVGGTIKVAGANVLNYFTTLGSTGRGASNATEFTRQKAKIIAGLRALNADVITLMEVENNGETALNDLVASLNAAIGKAEYASIKTGTVGTDAIRVAVIYRPGRVEPIGAAQIDTNAVYSRPPVAQTFRDVAGKGIFTVMANHFKSKGSCPTTGDVDTGQGCWNELRKQQAQAVVAFADRLKATDPDVMILGDLNAYGAEDPIKAIMNAGFESLNLRIPAEDRYSYQFNGEFGYLDHALSTNSMQSQVTGITEWHVNSDEPVVLDYNTEFKKHPECTGTNCTSPDLYAPTPYRNSDHDPVLVGLNLKADAEPTIPLTVTATGADTVTARQPYTLTYSTGGTPETVTVNWGDNTTDPVSASGTATHTFATSGSFTITVTAKRGTQTVTATKVVTVQAAPVVGAGRLVISQVYGGGGNGGAVYTNDFVELFNAGTAPVSLSGKSIQYAGAGSTATFTAGNTYALPTATVQPGKYFLVQMAAGAATVAPLPTPDATGALALGGTNGKLALVNNVDPISSRADTDVLDFLGYGSVAEFEGTAPAPATANSTASLRAGNGCTDTNQNSTDFTTVTPTPRNSASAAVTCP